MRKALVVVCIFIGIFAYNMYVPKKNTGGMRADEAASYVQIRASEQFIGVFVAAFFGGLSYFGLVSIVGHFEKKR